MTYIRIPLVTDPESLAQSVFQYIQNQAPNWTPQDGNLDVWIIRAVSALAAENRDIASDVQDDIFRYYGGLIGIPPLDAVSATAPTTWTMIDSAGYLIPAGTNVGITDSNGVVQGFQTVSDTIIPNGSNATPAGGVTIAALTPGLAGSGLGTANQVIQLIDVLDFVVSVVLINPTTGGRDAELDADYLARLSQRLQRLSQRPILPSDFAGMVPDADPSIARAVCIDGYNPANATYNNQRMVTVAAVDVNGNAVSPTVKNEIVALLQANREVNFIVNVMDPQYTVINVVASIHVLAGFDPTATIGAAVSSINNFLNPATWGLDPTVQQGDATNTWVQTPTLYFNDMITVITNTLGVDHVISLTINGGTADIALAAPAALVRAGTVTVTSA